MDFKKYYVLGNDLDFGNVFMMFLFILGILFSGSFDGKDFILKNINIIVEDDVYKLYLFIFGYIFKLMIKNVKLDNVYIDNEVKLYIGIYYVGLIVSKVLNNVFLLENIEIINLSVIISYNRN